MFYKYKYDDVDETLIISKYFFIDYIEGDYVYYNMTDKMLRKVKLLIIEQTKLSEKLYKIVKNSIYTTPMDVMERKFSRELADSIDREIIKSLMEF